MRRQSMVSIFNGKKKKKVCYLKFNLFFVIQRVIMKIIVERNVKEMMMYRLMKNQKPLMKFVCGKTVSRNGTMNQSLMLKEQIVASDIKLLWNMCVVFVGYSNTIIKVVLPGNGIFLIIMHLLHLIFSTYQQYQQNLKKEQLRFVFFYKYLIIWYLLFIIKLVITHNLYFTVPSTRTTHERFSCSQ